MLRNPPTSTLTDTPLPSPSLFRSRAEERPRAGAVDRERLEPAFGLGDHCGRRRLAHRAFRIPQTLVTWMVTPSPRSMTAPGSSCTAMPGWRSSGENPGWVSTVPLVDPMSRSEEHTSELQSLMRNSYAVFCLKKKKINKQQKE